MPNRILREGILTSERVNSLSWEAGVFYRRLMSAVDDFGRFSAHPSLLQAALYPLKLDTVRDANLERLLALVEQARLVRVYEVAGKRYVEMLDFRQQVRSKESKYPAPAGHLPSTCIADAAQVQSRHKASAHLDGDADGDVSEDGDGVGDAPRARASPAAAVCMSLRRAGIASVNMGHPLLLSLLQAGATEAEFLGAVPTAQGKSKPFDYLLGVVKGQREDAAKASQGLHRGPMPPPGKAPVDIAARNAEARRLLGFDTQPPLTGVTDA